MWSMYRTILITGAGLVLATAAFVLATLMLYWARWPHTGQIMLLLILPLPAFAYYESQRGWRGFSAHMRGAWWLVAYLATIALLSWAGSKEFEGHGYIGYGWDQLCVALAALTFCYWGVRSGWRTPAVESAHGQVPKSN